MHEPEMQSYSEPKPPMATKSVVRQVEEGKMAEDEFDEVAEEEVEEPKKKKGFFGFLKKKEEEPVEEEGPEAFVIEDDVKDVLKLSLKWIEQLPSNKLREFKSSPDFEKYREVLLKYNVAKRVEKKE